MFMVLSRWLLTRDMRVSNSQISVFYFDWFYNDLFLTTFYDLINSLLINPLTGNIFLTCVVLYQYGTIISYLNQVKSSLI